jgi:integrase
VATLTKKQGSPYWWLYASTGRQDDGSYGTIRKSTGIRHEDRKKPCAAALAILRHMEEKIARRKFGMSPLVEQKALKDFFNELANTETVRATTALLRRQSRTALLEWCDEAGIRLVCEVTYSVGARFLAEKLVHWAPSTTANRFIMLAQDWDEAKKRNYCTFEQNPFRHRIDVAPTERIPLTEDQVGKLLQVQSPEWFRRATRIGLATGARIASVWELEWQEVSFDLGTIAFKTSKTKPWVVPMHPSLRAYLEPLRKDTGLVLGEPPRGRSAGFIREAAKAGVKCNFHAFRHTLTTRMALGGVEKRLAMAITNHTSEGIHDHYTHLEAAKLGDVMAKIGVGY